MRTRLSLAVGAMLLLGLGGCVYYPGGYYDRYGYYDGGYEDDCDYDDDCGQYDGYYDGYYGPYVGGYWASDGFFYYWDRNRRYHRDHDRHFRHHAFDGGKPFYRYREGRGGHWRGDPGGHRRHH